jgi:hypothetical protein
MKLTLVLSFFHTYEQNKITAITSRLIIRTIAPYMHVERIEVIIALIRNNNTKWGYILAFDGFQKTSKLLPVPNGASLPQTQLVITPSTKSVAPLPAASKRVLIGFCIEHQTRTGEC